MSFLKLIETGTATGHNGPVAFPFLQVCRKGQLSCEQQWRCCFLSSAAFPVRLSPEFEQAYAIRAAAWAGKKDFDKALSDCNEAVRINPKSGLGYSIMASLLATCPNAAYRNGQKAVEYATKACERTNRKVADCLDTLAAA